MAMADAPIRPRKIAKIGHSNSRRLEESAVNGNNFNFPTDEVETAFFSRGGLVVPNLIGADILPPLISFQPDALIFLVGDNDIFFPPRYL